MEIESKRKATIKLVKLDKALKLAETWVNGMCESTAAQTHEVNFEGRPARLGLGARVTPSAKAAAPTAVERKLLGKLNASKRQSSKDFNRASPAEYESSGEDDDEPESRTSAFAKKRTMPSVTPPQSKKKK